MQIGFVKDATKKKAIILSTKKYHEAANYSIDKEKLAISSSFFDFIIFIIWLSFGLKIIAFFLVASFTNPICIKDV
jgi:STE24 endopeptidase